MEYRETKDTLGLIKVPLNAHYDAQTQRSKENFNICANKDRMPIKVIKSLALLKRCACKVNFDRSRVSEEHFRVIQKSCDDVISGKLDDFFPLVIWQTGSGTQTNMNVNEVIASRSNEYLSGHIGQMHPIHPNDHINMSQSSNDIFPTAMNVSVVSEFVEFFNPSMEHLVDCLKNLEGKFAKVIKIGRTHMQDAVPMTLGQEFSGYVAQIEMNLSAINHNLNYVLELAVGGTAVGTGLNAPKNFDVDITRELNAVFQETHKNKNKVELLKFKPASNKFAALAAHDALSLFSGSLATLATALFKIASDIRLLSSGPRCGLGEISIPPNEPGSSIMPGKVNPTQCEAITMVCLQVIANCHAVTMATSQGHLELNVFKPLIISNVLHSMELLSDASRSFTDKCLAGINVNESVIKGNLDRSCMVVTALNPIIGYENAAKIAKYAMENNLTVREAAEQTKLISLEEFDKAIVYENMI